MIKKIAWDTFKNTGNVDTFLELKQFQNIEAQMHTMQQQMEEQNGNNQNEWYNNF